MFSLKCFFAFQKLNHKTSQSEKVISQGLSFTSKVLQCRKRGTPKFCSDILFKIKQVESASDTLSAQRLLAESG